MAQSHEALTFARRQQRAALVSRMVRARARVVAIAAAYKRGAAEVEDLLSAIAEMDGAEEAFLAHSLQGAA